MASRREQQSDFEMCEVSIFGSVRSSRSYDLCLFALSALEALNLHLLRFRYSNSLQIVLKIILRVLL